MPTSTATGVFCDNPAPGRSQAGPRDPWGQGRLHEHQPKLKCLFLLPCWLCSCPAPPPITPACPWRALCTQRGPEAPGGHRERRRAASTQHVQTYPPDAHIPTGSGALRTHASTLAEDSLPICRAVPTTSASELVPTSVRPRWPLGSSGLRRGGGERSCARLLPWAANTSAHTPFRSGRGLSGQALTPPEWPLLPAKEHHLHRADPRSASAGPAHRARLGGQVGRRRNQGGEGWGLHPRAEGWGGVGILPGRSW